MLSENSKIKLLLQTTNINLCQEVGNYLKLILKKTKKNQELRGDQSVSDSLTNS